MVNRFMLTAFTSLLCLVNTTQPIIASDADHARSSNVEFKEFDENRDMDFLFKCCQEDHHWLGIPEFSKEDWEWKVLPGFSNRGQTTIILFVDNEPVGFGVYHREWRDWGNGFIQLLCVSNKYRGNHHANKLMQYMIDQLKKKTDYISIYVLDNNEIAKNLYSKFGFKEACKYPADNMLRLDFDCSTGFAELN